MEKTKKVHIFHISEFGGHSKAAQNIKEALLYKNPQLDVFNLNIFGYFYPRTEKVVDFTYMTTIKHFPHLWGRAYDKKKVIDTLAPYRKLVNKISFGKFNKLIRDNRPDCFVATQAFPCGVVADFKEENNLSIPLIAVVTDYHPHRFWVHPFVDRYVVACQEAKDVLVNEGVDKQKIKILGIPISVKFLTTYPKEEISKELNFTSELNSVLIMGGGLGVGPMKTIAKELDSLSSEFQMIVVCGQNKKLYDWFRRRKKKFKKPISVFSYIDNIHKLMDFSDIIVTKAGGITISEALAKGMCIIVTNPIPGQEERNVEYLLKQKAVIKANEAEDITGITQKLLEDKKKIYSLREAAKEVSFIDSSLRIVDLILELIS